MGVGGGVGPGHQYIIYMDSSYNYFDIMLETDHQQFQEPEYPAFPVVFQQELETEFELNTHPVTLSQPKKHIKIPEHDAQALFRETEKAFETKYPHLFKEEIQNSGASIENFFRYYTPIDQKYVAQMRRSLEDLKFIRIGDNKVYVGEVESGKCEGKGIILFKNGNLYEGDIVGNQRTGRGSYVHVNLGWYQGEFQNDQKHGQGLEVFYHKSAYRGTFVNGLRHNHGLYIDDESNIYNGTWKLGIMHGKGSLKTPKSVYTGNFVNWLKHGVGEEHFVNGDIYRGEYQNGRFDGIGTYEWHSDGAVYEGNFKNGLRHGKGKWSARETKYSGSYAEGLKEGYGELYFPSGNFYKGNFVQDKREGYGEMFWTDSSFYKGEWRNGLQNGKGQIYLAGGDILSGLFQNSMLVQSIPSIYEKQMEISNQSIHDLFGSKQKIEYSQRARTFSQHKQANPRKRLSKIEQTSKKKKVGPTIKHNLYFRSPEKSENSEGGGRECKCAKRFQNFRLKQKKRQNQSHSKYNDI